MVTIRKQERPGHNPNWRRYPANSHFSKTIRDTDPNLGDQIDTLSGRLSASLFVFCERRVQLEYENYVSPIFLSTMINLWPEWQTLEKISPQLNCRLCEEEAGAHGEVLSTIFLMKLLFENLNIHNLLQNNQILTCWPEILDTSSGRSNSWKIWKFTYIPLKCIPLKCILLKCMPLKCMYLKCVCLWNVCRWDPCLLIKAQNYHLFGSSRFITLLNLFPKYAMCQQRPGVEQERKECRKGFLSSVSANNVKRAHFSNPLQNVLLQRSLNSSKFLCTAQKCGRNACTDTVTPLTLWTICQKLVHPKLNLLTTNLNTHWKSKAYMDIWWCTSLKTSRAKTAVN